MFVCFSQLIIESYVTAFMVHKINFGTYGNSTTIFTVF